VVVEGLRRGEIGAERLLDDDPPPALVLMRQPGLAEPADDRRKCRRRRREIEEAIAARMPLPVEPCDAFAETSISLGFIRIARDVVKPLQERGNQVRLRLHAGEMLDAFLRAPAKPVIRQIRARKAEHRKILWQQAGRLEVIKRWREQALR